MSKKALISVTDKTDCVSFAKGLIELGYELISTGGTYDLLKDYQIDVQSIEEYTGYEEVLDGRVKTLHPKVHGSILYERDHDLHVETAEIKNFDDLDLVCVNLYEFEKTLKSGKSEKAIIESIDIGGPTLIRGAAKNFYHVLVVTRPEDYKEVLEHLGKGTNDVVFRKSMAAKAFSLIADYDALIAHYFNQAQDFPERITLPLRKFKTLRYGENPHQEAFLYKGGNQDKSLMDFEMLQGKQLSFNNYHDLFGALNLLKEFDNQKTTCVAVKHATPCGVAISDSPLSAFEKAKASDPVSIFGGIVVFNNQVDGICATGLNQIFLEVVAAPSFTPEALDILKEKPNLRVLVLHSEALSSPWDVKFLDGYWLVQKQDSGYEDAFNVVTERPPTEEEKKDMIFGMKVAKHLKSNAIAIVKDQRTLALCGGQTARVFALKNSIANSQETDFQGAVLASDGFFPFDDSVSLANEYKISGVIQPGGSLKDQLSIDACNRFGMTMVTTGMRHFKH